MSKLGPTLKALINAPASLPGPVAAPAKISDVYREIAREACENRFGRRPWLILSAAATCTLNSPDALLALHTLASASNTGDSLPTSSSHAPVPAAEIIREVGLKAISFNGIPRSINCLGAFRAGLPDAVRSALTAVPVRDIPADQWEAVKARGRSLWDSIYTPFERKLFDKLAASHPDLPVHILQNHYGTLLSDPEGESRLGRLGTSLVAIACLRAQTGAGPQLLSHVFGLRKGVEQGWHGENCGRRRDYEGESEVMERLATDEGIEWILRSVDLICDTIGGAFGRRRGSKL